MTLAELAESKKDYLVPADVASVLGCHPYRISLEAKQGTLPFPYIRSGSRTKIPREGFIAWMRGQIPNNREGRCET